MRDFQTPANGDADLRTLRRFIPYLWPADKPALRLRVVGSVLLVLLSIAITTLIMPLAYGAAIDRLVAGRQREVAIAVASPATDSAIRRSTSSG